MTAEPTPEHGEPSRLTVDELIEVDSGERWRRGLPLTRCRLRLYEAPGRPPVAVVTELVDNPGLSVTNAAEYVWRALARRLDSTRFTLVEHYGPESFAGGSEPAQFDVVTVGAGGEPSWRRISIEEVRELVGGARL